MNSKIVSKTGILPRVLIMVFIITFIAHDVLWAYPPSGPSSDDQESSTLAPTSFFSEKKSIDKLYAKAVETLIEQGSVARNVLQIGDVKTALDSHTGEKWFKDNIAYTAISSDGQVPNEVLISVSPGYALRYFDPRAATHEKYRSQILGTIEINDGLHKQLLKVAMLPGPAEALPGSINSVDPGPSDEVMADITNYLAEKEKKLLSSLKKLETGGAVALPSIKANLLLAGLPSTDNVLCATDGHSEILLAGPQDNRRWLRITVLPSTIKDDGFEALIGIPFLYDNKSGMWHYMTQRFFVKGEIVKTGRGNVRQIALDIGALKAHPLVAEFYNSLITAVPDAENLAVMPRLKVLSENPIMKPRGKVLEDGAVKFEWEWYVFNPAVIPRQFEGRYYMIYRALSKGRISHFGLAWSEDLVHWERLDYPIFSLDLPHSAEDPHVSIEGNEINLYYVDYDGTNPFNTCRATANFRDFMKLATAGRGYSKIEGESARAAFREAQLREWKDLWQNKGQVFDEVSEKDVVPGDDFILRRPWPPMSEGDTSRGRAASIWVSFRSKDPGRIWEQERELFLEPDFDKLEFKMGGGTNIVETEYGYVTVIHIVKGEKGDDAFKVDANPRRTYEGRLLVFKKVFDEQGKPHLEVVYLSPEPVLSPNEPYDNVTKAREMFGKYPYTEHGESQINFPVVFPTSLILLNKNDFLVLYGSEDNVISAARGNLEELIPAEVRARLTKDRTSEGRAPVSGLRKPTRHEEVRATVERLTASLGRSPNVAETARSMGSLSNSPNPEAILYKWFEDNELKPEDYGIARFSGRAESVIRKNFLFAHLRIQIPPLLSEKVKIVADAKPVSEQNKIELVSVDNENNRLTIENLDSEGVLRFTYIRPDGTVVSSDFKKDAKTTSASPFLLPAFRDFYDTHFSIPLGYSPEREKAVAEHLKEYGDRTAQKDKDINFRGNLFFPSFYVTHPGRADFYRDRKSDARWLVIRDAANPDNFIGYEWHDDYIVSLRDGTRLTPDTFIASQGKQLPGYYLHHVPHFVEFDEALDKSIEVKTASPDSTRHETISIGYGRFAFRAAVPVKIISFEGMRAQSVRDDKERYPVVLRREDTGEEIHIKYRDPKVRGEFIVDGLTWEDGSPVILKGHYFNLSTIIEEVSRNMLPGVVVSPLLTQMFYYMEVRPEQFIQPIRGYKIDGASRSLVEGDLIDSATFESVAPDAFPRTVIEEAGPTAAGDTGDFEFSIERGPAGNVSSFEVTYHSGKTVMSGKDVKDVTVKQGDDGSTFVEVTDITGLHFTAALYKDSIQTLRVTSDIEPARENYFYGLRSFEIDASKYRPLFVEQESLVVGVRGFKSFVTITDQRGLTSDILYNVDGSISRRVNPDGMKEFYESRIRGFENGPSVMDENDHSRSFTWTDNAVAAGDLPENFTLWTLDTHHDAWDSGEELVIGNWARLLKARYKRSGISWVRPDFVDPKTREDGSPVFAYRGTLEGLPAPQGPVVLSIDLDYFSSSVPRHIASIEEIDSKTEELMRYLASNKVEVAGIHFIRSLKTLDYASYGYWEQSDYIAIKLAKAFERFYGKASKKNFCSMKLYPDETVFDYSPDGDLETVTVPDGGGVTYVDDVRSSLSETERAMLELIDRLAGYSVAERGTDTVTISVADETIRMGIDLEGALDTLQQHGLVSVYPLGSDSIAVRSNIRSYTLIEKMENSSLYNARLSVSVDAAYEGPEGNLVVRAHQGDTVVATVVPLSERAAAEAENTELYRQIMLESRDECLEIGVCMTHATEVCRRLLMEGIDAEVVGANGHYWAETKGRDGYILDSFPEGMIDGRLEEAQALGDKRFVLVKKISVTARKFYHGQRDERLSNNAENRAKDERGFYAKRRDDIRDRLSYKISSLLKEGQDTDAVNNDRLVKILREHVRRFEERVARLDEAEVKERRERDARDMAKGVSLEIMGLLGSIHKLMPIPASVAPGSKILLSETLFDVEDLVALKTVLNTENIEILPPGEIRDRAMNSKATRENLSIILSKEEFENKDLWKDSDKETRLKASVVLLDEKLTGVNYLYLEGVIGFARSVMNRDNQAIRSYYSLLSGEALSDEILESLKDSPVAFAIKAILKFRPITVQDPQELENSKKIMEEYLRAA